MNAHDVGAFVALFADDYDSRQPAHPDRAFRGRAQVRENWSAIFAAVPDFRADLISTASAADSLWTEWRWQGTQAGGGRLDMTGVIVFGLRDGLFAWARLYSRTSSRAGLESMPPSTRCPAAAEPRASAEPVSGYRCRSGSRHGCSGPREPSRERAQGSLAAAHPPAAVHSRRTCPGADGPGTGRRRRCSRERRCADRSAGPRARAPRPLAARTADPAAPSRPDRWDLRRHVLGSPGPSRPRGMPPRTRRT